MKIAFSFFGVILIAEMVIYALHPGEFFAGLIGFFAAYCGVFVSEWKE